MISTIKKTDSQIQKDVLRELTWDTRVDETDVGVEVDGGVVTLTGTVDNWAKKMAAVEAAHRVIGVLDVANDIKVRPPGSAGRTDTEIAQAVRRAIDWDAFLFKPQTYIETTVSEGIVTLDGSVEFWSQREDAERSVRNLLGVRGVVNRIAVKSQNRVTASEVRRSIEEALERRASREARRIELAVGDGKVALSGDVASWKEREAVLGAARSTIGVRTIEDKLRIRP